MRTPTRTQAATAKAAAAADKKAATAEKNATAAVLVELCQVRRCHAHHP